jgi:DUF1680 family protein
MSSKTDSLEIRLKDIFIQDKFWSEYQRLVREKVLPYQWEALNDRIPEVEKSHCIANYRIAAGLAKGEFYGYIFQDTDVSKWLETVGFSLNNFPNSELEKTADEVIELLANAQQPDGYLNSYFTVKEPGKRWTNLREAHELYCAGHLIEGAVAYYQATGKKQLLDIACRFADLIDRTFGEEAGKVRGYCGHPEIELALVKLYQTTGQERYLKLSRYFISERGKQPNVFVEEAKKPGALVVWQEMKDYDLSYSQCHVPLKEQDDAGGHAVRLVYLYAGAADIARLTGDEELKRACERIWNNVTLRKMYVTGGIGSAAQGEAFTGEYDLPNDTMYTETCAAIGLAMFASRMLKMEANTRYSDIMELAIYNGALSGMSLDGTKYFYVNPLEIRPGTCARNPGFKHVKPVRQSWYGCACCPPNIARLISSIGSYAYTLQDADLYAHLYVGSVTRVKLNGVEFELKQESGLPYAGNVRFLVKAAVPAQFHLHLRIPGWATNWRCKVNGIEIQGASLDKGYLKISRIWQSGDTVELDLDMSVRVLQSNPKVSNNVGKLALQRGPLVYCIEEVDNGQDLHDIRIPKNAEWKAVTEPGLLGGTTVIAGKGLRTYEPGWENKGLYSTQQPVYRSVEVRAVPYSLWCNRKSGEMRVWLNEIN